MIDNATNINLALYIASINVKIYTLIANRKYSSSE